MTASRTSRRLCVWVLATHALLLAWMGGVHSPVVDEPGHMAAGIYSWQFGRFDVYRVNPPLVRTVAAAPVVLAGPHMSWYGYGNEPRSRPEWELGRQFIGYNRACVLVLRLGPLGLYRFLPAGRLGVLAMGR